MTYTLSIANAIQIGNRANGGSSKPLITVDGNVWEWAASQRIDYGDLSGYSLYAQAQGDSRSTSH